MLYYSIWQDAIYTVTGMTEFSYNITTDSGSTLIYSGKAYMKPNASSIEVNVSRIVQDYLNSTLNDASLASNGFVLGREIEPYAVFNCAIGDLKDNVLAEYSFLNCWDYKTPFSIMQGAGMDYPLSKPINNHAASGMYGFRSVFGKVSHQVETTITTADANTCGVGAIYYANNLGGWDAFLIEGNAKKSETYDRYEIQNGYRVQTLEFGHKIINHTSQLKWDLTTHYMTDTESERFAEQVIGSIIAYYHDFTDNAIYPVTIDDNSVEYKQFKSNGRKFAQYNFKITSAQDRQRR